MNGLRHRDGVEKLASKAGVLGCLHGVGDLGPRRGVLDLRAVEVRDVDVFRPATK
ncbi:hypothetical protein CGERO_03075 [Corynebacterium gerontici]|uniref:Uncharacterized protein n=1 Tax=Corynebacterium gerontici TaxID=2079234 RepID=A0A3G6J1T0_9CORY|nr:hypothetical protein [Corynebacterium gerontici]AZA10938.1 hypothetical protein CGERO_03075 [Corynebacterium gerontici]